MTPASAARKKAQQQGLPDGKAAARGSPKSNRTDPFTAFFTEDALGRLWLAARNARKSMSLLLSEILEAWLATEQTSGVCQPGSLDPNRDGMAQPGIDSPAPARPAVPGNGTGTVVGT